MVMRATLVSRIVTLFALMTLVLTAVPFSALAQGNSGAAKLCEDGGYLNWTTQAGGEPFQNTGQCVRFAAEGGNFALVIPAGWMATISRQTLNSCNSLSFGYNLGGAFTHLGMTSLGCQVVSFPDVTIGPATESQPLFFYVADHRCANAYFPSDGDHGRVASSLPTFEVDIADAGPDCEFRFTARPVPAAGDGNLSLTVTIHRP
jgi:hypothetical protein